MDNCERPLAVEMEGGSSLGLSESTPEFLSCDNALSYSRYGFKVSQVTDSLIIEMSGHLHNHFVFSNGDCISRYTPSMSRKQLFPDSQQEHYLDNEKTYFVDRGDSLNCSNFLDVDWMSSSGNSCEEETYER